MISFILKIIINMKKKIIVFCLLLLIFLGIIVLSYDFFKMKENTIYEKINAQFYINKKTTDKQKIKIDENITEINSAEEKEENNNENVITQQINPNEPIAVLEIPKINLYQNLYPKQSELNTISKNVKIMNEAVFPDVNNGNFILAAHSGTGYIAFFKNLHKLVNNDKVYIYYNNIKYEYEIVLIYDENKDGDISLEKDPNQTVITLITCKYKDKTKQTIFVGNLVNKTNY